MFRKNKCLGGMDDQERPYILWPPFFHIPVITAYLHPVGKKRALKRGPKTYDLGES